MRKRQLLCACIALFSIANSYGQTYTMKKAISSIETMELLNNARDLFEPTADISFFISTSDAMKNFSGIQNQEPYDDTYLAKHRASIKADPKNPMPYNSLANYYRFHEKNDSATFYFTKSLGNMSLSYFRDSSSFLSFRGVLNLNLGKPEADADIQRSIALNPNDTLAAPFYLISLINTGNFDKASTFSQQMLAQKPASPEVPYVMLICSELMKGFVQKTGEAADDEKVKAKYAATDYNKLFDFTLIDQYAAQFKGNIHIRNARLLGDIFALVFKVGFFTGLNEPRPVFSFTQFDKETLASLEKKFLSAELKKDLNPYTRNKVLGFISFLQQKNEKAISYLEEATRTFPAGKRTDFFNPSEAYDAIFSIHYMNRDSLKQRQALISKINAAPLGKKVVKDHFRLAQNYFLGGDLQKAAEWATKAWSIDSTDFNTLRLLAHLYFLDGSPGVDVYANNAAKNMRSKHEQYLLVMQFAIYNIITRNAPTAYENIAIARQSGEEAKCTLCDELLEKYITVTPKQ